MAKFETTRLSRGDTLEWRGGKTFTVGEPVTFKSDEQVQDFLDNSRMVYWEWTVYPSLFCLFGGPVEKKQMSGLVRVKP